MQFPRSAIAGLLALQSLAACGCCLFPGMYAQNSPYAAPGAAQLAAGGANVAARAQSPDGEGGLFEFPSWKELRKSSFFNGVAKVAGYDLNEPLSQKYYKEGEALVKEGELLLQAARGEDEKIAAEKRDEAAEKFAAAAPKFKAAARHWPDSPLEEDALFWLGECYFFTDKYPAASDAYANMLKKYENSRHLDKAVTRQFAVGRYWQELQQAKPKYSLTPNVTDKTRPRFDTSGNTQAVYEGVRLHDPTGPLADDAVMASATEFFVNDDFVSADEFYTLLRNDYPKSEHLTHAYLLGLKAKLHRYEGPQYDSAPLTEAKKLVDEMLIQFPVELGEERDKVLHDGRLIVAQLAEREWAMGEYYYRTRHYRAAGMYYQHVLKEFSETKYAEMARQRLEEIKDKPPTPPDRFSWIDKILPASSRRAR